MILSKRRLRPLLVLLWISACLSFPIQAQEEKKKSRVIKIGTLPEEMRYDRNWIGVTPGERITIELKNTDSMTHNLVVCRPGKNVAMRVAQAAWNLGAKAIEKAYVPDHPAVIAATGLVEPGKTGKLTFTTPEKKGNYPFVCTWPGHALLMRGILHVGNPGDTEPVLRVQPKKIPASALDRARQKMQRYRLLMDGGPTIAGVFFPDKPTKTNGKSAAFGPTNRGIAVQVGDREEGGALFDAELMRFTAAWTGRFVRFREKREDERAEYRFEIGGKIFHKLTEGTGWASSDGKWIDPRPKGLGQLSASRLNYLGQYRAGKRVIFHYEVNGVKVLDSPWMKVEDGKPVFTRDIRVAARNKSMRLRLAPSHGTNAATSNHPDLSIRGGDGFHQAIIKPGKNPILFQVVVSPLPCSTGTPIALDSQILSGNKGKAGPAIITQGKLGNSDAPYAVDTLTLPYENPWNSLLYIGGHDFFSNGDAALCTSHGDVWTVSGIDRDLKQLTWKRMATGLANPLGLRIVNDVVYVVGLHEITRLHDTDGDGAADYYESFNDDCEVSERHHRFTTDLQTDTEGNFYYLKCTDEGRSAHAGSLIRVSPDGKKFEQFATGLRNPNGMAIGPGNVITFGKQQGGWIPSSGIHVVEQGKFYGYMPSHHRETRPEDFEKPLCWIPHGIDNSCGGQAWAPGGNDKRWGPLAGNLMHLSYGNCRMFLVLHEKIGKVYQGGVIRIPGIEFESGAMRARFRPQDGQLYVSGLRGWQTTAAMPGCFQRVRYTGKPVHLPSKLEVVKEGIRLSYYQPLAEKAASDPKNYKIQQWQYKWTKNYGSPDLKISDPKQKGRDEVQITSAELTPDGKSVLLRIKDLNPVMQMSVSYELKSKSGVPVKGEIFNTINVVPGH